MHLGVPRILGSHAPFLDMLILQATQPTLACNAAQRLSGLSIMGGSSGFGCFTSSSALLTMVYVHGEQDPRWANARLGLRGYDLRRFCLCRPARTASNDCSCHSNSGPCKCRQHVHASPQCCINLCHLPGLLDRLDLCLERPVSNQTCQLCLRAHTCKPTPSLACQDGASLAEVLLV